MVIVILLLGLALLVAVTLLGCTLHQLELWAAELNAAPPDSNLRLGAGVRLGPVLRASRAVNARLETARQAVAEARHARQELQYTMAAVSHDIRTPLAGAAGYLELLEETEAPARQAEYRAVIAQRLADLEQLLDELFAYTRLAGGQPPPDCRPVSVWPTLCESLAALYPQLARAGVEPQPVFENEALRWQADPEALARIFHNLILNGALHGEGPLAIREENGCLSFSNAVPVAALPDADRLFDRFWRADASRQSRGTGLGLSIVRQLTEQMGGSVSAAVTGNTLTVTLRLPAAR